jgi:hypothetical protein
MTDARAVVGMDRLPWLMDEPRPQASAPAMRGSRELLGWAVAGLLVVAVASYWLGTRVVQPGETPIPAETVKLPDARENAEPQVPIVESPLTEPEASVAQKVEKSVQRTRATPVSRRKTLSPMELSGSDLEQTVAEQESTPSKPESSTAQPTESAKAPPVAAAPARPKVASTQRVRLWPATESKGASGRIVRIGAFGSRQQAKLGWRRMQRVYPAVARLPATVVTDRNSNGRVFYRFQIGTTSQAHSEVLCQRMDQMLRFSCAVVGLPWKAKVER